MKRYNALLTLFLALVPTAFAHAAEEAADPQLVPAPVAARAAPPPAPDLRVVSGTTACCDEHGKVEVVPPLDRPIHLANGRWTTWRGAQSRYRARIGVGAAFIGLGALFEALAVAAGASSHASIARCVNARDPGCMDLGYTVSFAAAGATVLAIAIPTLVSGLKLRGELLRRQLQVSVGPTTGGAMAGVGMRF